MKRKFLTILIFIFMLFIPNVYALDNTYEVLYKMDSELVDNTFTIQMGLREESAMAIMNSISFNTDKLELVDIDGNDYFTITKGKEIKDGKYSNFKILADSEYGFEKVYYANITFKIKNGFRKGERSEIYISGNKLANADEDIKTAKAMTFTVFYNKDGTVSYVAEEQNFMTQVNRFVTDNWKLILISLIGLLILFIIIRYVIIFKDVKKYEKENNHNHIVDNMKFAKVPDNLNMVDNSKPEKVRIAKVGKFKLKKQKNKSNEIQSNYNFNDLMKEDTSNILNQEPINNEQIIYNQNNGNDNNLPDDFSSFGESTNNYAYDDTTATNNSDGSNGANLNDLEKINLHDDNSSSKIGLFLGLLLITGLFNIKSVYALDNDQMNNLRNMIIGNITWSSEYDINNDNVIDMLDIIASKDINNITIIQDIVTVKESKPENNFVLKSTKPYVRTTRNGTTKIRTTANGSWKNTTANTTSSSSNIPVTEKQEITTKKAESVDVSNNDGKRKYTISITYNYGSGDYDNVKVSYGGSITFDTYPQSEGYQRIASLYCNIGNITNDGYKVTISNVTNDAMCSVSFGKSNTINASVNYFYEGDNITETDVIKYTNQSPDSTFAQKIKINENYNYKSITCNGGFKNYSVENGIFKGTIGESSGTCTIRLSPKDYTTKIYYNGMEEVTISGKYHTIIKNVALFDSVFPSDKLKLNCNGNYTNPKSVVLMEENINGYKYKGYKYTFDVKIEGTTCYLE